MPREYLVATIVAIPRTFYFRGRVRYATWRSPERSAHERVGSPSHRGFLAIRRGNRGEGFLLGLWAYLVTPLLSLLLWYLGFRLFFEETAVRSGYQAFLEPLENYGLAVLAILIVTLAWIVWNRRRYGVA